MNEITINLKQVCKDNIYTRDHGHVLFDLIAQALPKYDKITIEFDKKEIASESFLDEAIVEHYIHPVYPTPEKKIVLHEVTRSDQMLMNRIYSYRKRLEKKQAIAGDAKRNNRS